MKVKTGHQFEADPVDFKTVCCNVPVDR